MDATAGALARLRDKYVEIRAMRLATERPERARARMRALSVRFPGALRELDTLPLEIIEARIEALEPPLFGEEPGEIPEWAEVLLSFHGWMRLRLRICGEHRRDAAPDVVLAWLRGESRSEEEPELAELEVAHVAALLRPPRGSATGWVLEEIARRRGASVEEIAQLAFPPA